MQIAISRNSPQCYTSKWATNFGITAVETKSKSEALLAHPSHRGVMLIYSVGVLESVRSLHQRIDGHVNPLIIDD
jgi:hypothetical protein